jgi:hypothetical protein
MQQTLLHHWFFYLFVFTIGAGRAEQVREPGLCTLLVQAVTFGPDQSNGSNCWTCCITSDLNLERCSPVLVLASNCDKVKPYEIFWNVP